jgi:hypothetical protein
MSSLKKSRKRVEGNAIKSSFMVILTSFHQVVTAATQLQRKYKQVPKLDLLVKRRQIADLIVDLARDAKTSLIKERSNRDELLSEIFHGLVGWLDVIWTVVYEHNVQFAAAHTCLIFVADTLIQLSETSTLGG